MARPKDIAELRINGRPFVGWTDVELTTTLDSPCREGSLTLAKQTGDGSPTEFSAPMDPSLPIEIWARDDTGSGRRDRLLTGWAGDGRSFRDDGRGERTTVRAFSKTVDVVHSCPAERFVFKNRTRFEIATALCAAHSVTVVMAPGVVDTYRVPRFKAEVSEAINVSLTRLFEGSAYFLTDDARGRLVIATVGALQADVALVYGEPGANILWVEGEFDALQRYSTYVCRGQRAGDDQDTGTACCEAAGTATDSWQTRNRILYLEPRRGMDAGQAKTHAEHEAALRAGRSATLRCGVVGWRQKPGAAMWRPNLRVQFRHARRGIDCELLVSAVTMRQTPQTQQAELTLAPVTAYAPEILPARVVRPTRKYSDLAGYLAAVAGQVGSSAQAAAEAVAEALE